MAENIKKNDKRDSKKSFNNATAKPKNLHTSIFKFKVIAAGSKVASNLDLSAVFNILQNISYDLISIPVTIKTTDDNGKSRINKVGYINNFEAHMSDEEFKITILSNFISVYNSISNPIVKILVRTDKKSGEPVQVLGFEIAQDE